MDKYKKLATNTLIFAIGTFSSKILSFLLMPYVTRMLGTGDYGSADLIENGVLKEYNGPGGEVTVPIGVRSLSHRIFAD